MKFCFFTISLYTFIIFGAFNSLQAKNTNFNYNAKNISSYFSALISFDDYDYSKSHEFFKKINDTKKNESRHSSKYIQTLMSLEKYSEAERYSRLLENKKKSNFESKLILGLSELKKENSSKAKSYFSSIDNTFEQRAVYEILKKTLNNWSVVDEIGIDSVENIPNEYKNFKKIQKTLANCYFDTPKTSKLFKEMLDEKKEDYSRYHFFFANYLLSKNKKSVAIDTINFASKEHPRNLLINQYRQTLLKKEKNKNKFNCKVKAHILAEIFYVIANALSVQGNYELSNFYVNLSKYLNPNFLSYNSLLAENYAVLKKYNKSKKIYKMLSNLGSVYKWHADRQTSFILDYQKEEKQALKFLKESYDSITPDVYQTFDYANFLKDRKKYKSSINLYTKILAEINKDHKLYPKVLDRRGTAYERINEWDLSEKDLLKSLEILPNQPYVMNYLAYSWLENGKNFKKALNMLREANDLKKNDGYITDSLGWALYKLNRFEEAKEYLKIAVILMPSDPIVNDHFADCLWKNNQKIQARYYWSHVLKIETTEKKLKKNIENKLIFGL